MMRGTGLRAGFAAWRSAQPKALSPTRQPREHDKTDQTISHEAVVRQPLENGVSGIE